VRSFLVSFALLMALIVIGGLAFIYSGLFDVAASEPHWRITHWILETARTRSIKVTLPTSECRADSTIPSHQLSRSRRVLRTAGMGANPVETVNRP
jgi:hypothetical protein